MDNPHTRLASVVTVLALGMCAAPPLLFAGFDEPSCAKVEARWPFGSIGAVAGAPGRLVFTRGRMLEVASLEAGALPVVLGQLELSSPVDRLAIRDNLVVITFQRGGLATVDISKPSAPALLGAIDYRSTSSTSTSSSGTNDLVAVTGRSVLVKTYDEIRAVELDGTGRPISIRRTGLPRTAILVTERRGDAKLGFAFIPDTVGYSGRVAVLDLSDPTSPTEIGTTGTFYCGASCRYDLLGIDIFGDIAVIVSSSKGILRIDSSQPEAPRLGDWIPLPFTAESYTASDEGIYACAHYDQCVPVTVSQTGAVSFGESFTATHEAYTMFNVAMAGESLMAWGTGFLSTLDASEFAAPRLGDQVDFHDSPSAVAAQADTVFVVARDELIVLDESTRGTLTRRGACDLRTSPDDDAYYPFVRVLDNKVLLVARSFGSMDSNLLVDVSNLDRPTVVAALPSVGSLYGFADDRNRLALLNMAGTLTVFDLTEPSEPEIEATVEFEPMTWLLALRGSVLWMAQAGEVRQVDISDPSTPHVIASWRTDALDYEDDKVRGAVFRNGSVWLGGDTDNKVALVRLDWPDGREAVVEQTWKPGAQGVEARDSGFFTELTLCGDAAVVSRLGATVVGIVDVGSSRALRYASHAPMSGRFAAFRDAPERPRVVLANREAGVDILDLSACRASFPVADFAWTPTLPRSSDKIDFVDASTGFPTDSSWQLPLGSQPDRYLSPPVAVFDSPGSYPVSLTATNESGSSTVTTHVVVLSEPAADALPDLETSSTLIVPVAASSPGAQGTRWKTDLTLAADASGDVDDVRLHLVTSATDGSEPLEVALGLAQSSGVQLRDVVRTAMEQDPAVGALVITSSAPIAAVSRTFNDDPSGTYGQMVPALPLSAARTGTTPTTLIQLARTSRFRTNFGFANLTDQPLTLQAAASRADGSSLGTWPVSLGPYGFLQQNDPLSWLTGDPVEDAFVVVSAADADARYIAYASVVDNVSGDAVFVLPPSDFAAAQVVPAAVSAPGLYGTNWSSELELYNPGPSAASCTVELIPEAGQTARVSDSIDVLAGTARRIRDVIGTLFRLTGKGALAVDCGSQAVAVTSRTFNDPGDRTYGQFIPGRSAAGFLEGDEPVRLIGLESVRGGERLFRTNIGLVNLSEEALEVELHFGAVDGDLQDVPTRTAHVPAGSFQQLDDVFAGTAKDGPYWVEVEAGSPDASFLAYASVTDNRSGDPVFIEPVR